MGKGLTAAAKTLGKAGGNKRAKTMSKAKRSSIAKKGGKAGGRGRGKRK